MMIFSYTIHWMQRRWVIVPESLAKRKLSFWAAFRLCVRVLIKLIISILKSFFVVVVVVSHSKPRFGQPNFAITIKGMFLIFLKIYSKIRNSFISHYLKFVQCTYTHCVLHSIHWIVFSVIESDPTHTLKNKKSEKSNLSKKLI